MLTLQIMNSSNMGIMSCLGQGVLHLLRAFYTFDPMKVNTKYRLKCFKLILLCKFLCVRLPFFIIAVLMMLVQSEISALADANNLFREGWMRCYSDSEEHLSGSTIEGAMMARLFQVTPNSTTSTTPISSRPIYHCNLRPPLPHLHHHVALLLKQLLLGPMQLCLQVMYIF